MKHTIIAGLLALLWATPLAYSQSLAEMAPANAVLSLSLNPKPELGDTLSQDLAALDWDEINDIFERATTALEESGALEELMYELDSDARDFIEMWVGIQSFLSEEGVLYEDLISECPALADVSKEHLAFVGQEALLTVSMTSYDPMPSILALTRLPDAQGNTGILLREAILGCAQAEDDDAYDEITQDDITLYQLNLGFQAPRITIGNVGDVFIIGSSPEVARAAVRLAQGSDEPSLATSDLYTRQANVLQQSGLGLTLDTAQIADIVEGFKAMIVEDDMTEMLFERGLAVLRTLGGVASTVSPVEEGLVAESLLAVNPDGGDAALASLISCEGCAIEVTGLAPAGSVAVASHYLGLEPFLDYLQMWLDDIAPYTGLEGMSLRDLAGMAGIDIDMMLFDWLGDKVHMVMIEPASERLSTLLYAPETAWIIPVDDVEAAEQARGVWAEMWPLAQMGLSQLSELAADPSDAFGLRSVVEYVAVDSFVYEGIDIAHYRVSFNSDFAAAIVNDHFVIATPASAMMKIIDTANGTLPSIAEDEQFAQVRASLPENISALSYSDDATQLREYAKLIHLGSQPIAAGIRTAIDFAFMDMSYDYDDYDDYDYSFEEPAGDLSEIAAQTLEVNSGFEDSLGAAAGEADTEDLSLTIYELDVAPGDLVAVTLNSADFDTYLELLAETDAGLDVLIYNDDFDGSYDQSQIAFSAEEGVRYFAVATSYAQSGSGSYTITLAEADAVSEEFDYHVPFESEHSVDGVTLTLASGDEAEGLLEVVEGDEIAAYYELTGVELDSEITVNLASEDFDTYLMIIDRDAEMIIAQNDDFEGDYTRSQLTFTAEPDVTYWVKATSYNRDETGSYTLDVTTGTEEEEAIMDDDYAMEEYLTDEELMAIMPTFSELLTLTDLLPEILYVIADHLSTSGGYSHSTEEGIVSRHTMNIAW